MENIIRLTILDYDFIKDFKQIFKKILIAVIILCVCTCAFYTSAQYLNKDSTVQYSGTCIKHMHLSDPAVSVTKPSIESVPSITDALELPEISTLSEPTAKEQTDIVSDTAPDTIVTEDIISEPAVDITIPLPEESSDEISAPADNVDSSTLYMGFVLSESGMITGCVRAECNLQDGLLVLPSDVRCTGVAEGAFDNIKGDVMELFIPENITYIAPGALNSLTNLMYIQVLDGNPAYYSEKGCLYDADGNYIAGPLRKSKGADTPEA